MTKTLGEKLAEIQSLLVLSGYDKSDRSVDIEEVRAQRDQRIAWLDGIEKQIQEHIEAGKNPSIKIENDQECEAWLNAAEGGKARFQKLYSDWIERMNTDEQLSIRIAQGRDSGAMKSWVNVLVSPTSDLTAKFAR